MTGHGAKFHRKKEEAIVALLSHRTVEEAGRFEMAERIRQR
jgi:hypothetical protein